VQVLLPPTDHISCVFSTYIHTDEKDARMLGIKSWWSTAINREEWRQLLSEATMLRKL
jgi:hypothetical protein